MSKPGEHTQRKQAERFKAYTELRDAGTLPVDAGREVGVGDQTTKRYERSYRNLRGLPPGRQQVWR